MESTITTAISAIDTDMTRTLLILDSPTLPLAISADKHNAMAFSSALLSLRANPRIHAAVVSLPADDPFVGVAQSVAASEEKAVAATPLDRESAAFIVGCVQQARVVVACRRLGTGWAADVSGVVRATRGGAADEHYQDEPPPLSGESEINDGEWLYHVSGDGAVKVWERGAADER